MRKVASPSGHPTNVSTQVQLAATCDLVWPGLKISKIGCSLGKIEKITKVIRPVRKSLVSV